jgi:hypothetical protein
VNIRHSLAISAALLGLSMSTSCLAAVGGNPMAWPDGDGAPHAADTAPAAATDPNHDADWDKVLQLGNIQVQGSREEVSRRIVAGLKVIKAALTAKISNDPAHANDIVCRMNYDTGSHLIVHLRCATNAVLRTERGVIASNMLVTTYGQANDAKSMVLEHLATASPQVRYFSTTVNAAELQKLLLLVKCEDCSENGLVVGNN